MTDHDSRDDNDDDALPNELPPVQPPSAGFILQLFLIPGLIIAVIVGVVFLFGLIASSTDEDWREMVQNVSSPNQQIRWRAAMGLAQVLPLDEKQAEAGEQLVSNRQVAEALCQLLDEELQKASPNEEEIQFQAFLTRTIQLMRVPDLVVPVLEKSIEVDRDLEVRKNGLAAIAIVANRAEEAGQPLSPEMTEKLVASLSEVSTETTPANEAPLMRQMSAFALGMFHNEQATRRLQVLLGDSNAATRANAMIGLARNSDSSGYPVLLEILESAAEPRVAEEDEFQRFASIKNAILVVEQLASIFTAEQQTQVLELLQPIADNHPEPRIRIDAARAIEKLTPAQ